VISDGSAVDVKQQSARHEASDFASQPGSNSAHMPLREIQNKSTTLLTGAKRLMAFHIDRA